MDEADIAPDAWLLQLYVPILDRSDCLHPQQCRLGTSQRSEALAVSEQPLQSGMVAFHTVVQILAVDMGDIVKVWIVAMADLADHLVVGERFISADRNGGGAAVHDQ